MTATQRRVRPEPIQVEATVTPPPPDWRIDEVMAQLSEQAKTQTEQGHKLDKILEILGQEKEDGKGGYVAVGLLGRLRRVEEVALKLVKTYEGWFKFGAGFGAAGAISLTVIWFLTKGTIAAIFGAH